MNDEIKIGLIGIIVTAVLVGVFASRFKGKQPTPLVITKTKQNVLLASETNAPTTQGIIGYNNDGRC